MIAESVAYLLSVFLVISLVLVIQEFIMIKLNKRWWNKWNKNKRNFPFLYKGKELWYSRSVATALFVFAKDANNNLYVLANKRGSGTPDYQGYWNCMCGYIDYDETAERCATRECKEETGLDIPEDKLRLVGIESSPSANRQNITIRYMALLDETLTKDSPLMNFDTSNSEEDEVADIRWINIDDIDLYDWAFNHNKRIKKIVENLL